MEVGDRDLELMEHSLNGRDGSGKGIHRRVTSSSYIILRDWSPRKWYQSIKSKAALPEILETLKEVSHISVSYLIKE